MPYCIMLVDIVVFHIVVVYTGLHRGLDVGGAKEGGLRHDLGALLRLRNGRIIVFSIKTHIITLILILILYIYIYIYIYTHIANIIRMCIYIYIYIYIWSDSGASTDGDPQQGVRSDPERRNVFFCMTTANLCTKILDFRGLWLKHNLNLKGWNSQAHREFPGNLESTNLSREMFSREIGRSKSEVTFCRVHYLSASMHVVLIRTSWASSHAPST